MSFSYREQYYKQEFKKVNLMNQDKEVLSFDFSEGIYDILDEKLLPFQLKGKLDPMPSMDISFINQEDMRKAVKEFTRASTHNQEQITSYFASRVLPITRENAKKIYGLFGFEQAQDEYSKARIAIICRSVSLLDNYWIRLENDEKSWKDVDIRNNSLSEVVAQVALHGSSLTLQGEPCTPELNGLGAYAKAWIREEDGLYLHKTGAKESDEESKVEIMVSNILDKTNVNHVQYFPGSHGDRFTCKCKCMTTQDLSILSGMDYISYCNVNSMNPDIEMMKIDKDNLMKMWIVDYLVSNPDRHGQNWGFYYNANSMELEGCHPLFDHNNAFDKELMANKDAPYLFNDKMTMKEAAQYAIKRTNFNIIEDINKEDFLSTDQYDSFKERADDIGITLQHNRVALMNQTLDAFINKNNTIPDEAGQSRTFTHGEYEDTYLFTNRINNAITEAQNSSLDSKKSQEITKSPTTRKHSEDDTPDDNR